MSDLTNDAQGYAVALSGPVAESTAPILVRRLVELGYRAEWVAAEALWVWSGNVSPSVEFVVACCQEAVAPEGAVRIETDAHDTPDFAAEKALDILAEKGSISLELHDYTPEEEEQIRKRLADLGYIE